MVSTEQTINTYHEDMIHDAQMDYYGKRLATASSDRTIRIFDVVEGNYQLIATLPGHSGAVWQVSWAHPKFGNIIASCSYDKRVIIWKEEPNRQWAMVWDSAQFNVHESSVNSVAWAPHEYGLRLACGSSDGRVSVITHNPGDESWQVSYISEEPAHREGCNAVSWAPFIENVPPRLATGGCDNMVRVWRFSGQEQRWHRETELRRDGQSTHDDWVRDVAWAPSVGLPGSLIATCGQDMKVYIWTQDSPDQEFQYRALGTGFPDVVWRVSWSVTGNVLAVSSGDKITLWKEPVEGDWQMVKAIEQ